MATVSEFVFIAKAQEGAVTLRPGIVIDPKDNVVYAITPEGVSALDLRSGKERWTNRAAAKPLSVSDDLLISQVEPSTRSNRLELVTLDSKTGKVKVRSVTDLPNSVRVAIGQTLEGKFETEARMLNDTAIVTWRFNRRPLRGKLDENTVLSSGAEVSRVSNAVSPTAAIQEPTQGVFRVNMTTGTVSSADPGLAEPMFNRDWILAGNEKVSGAPPTQYESADNRHIMASERIGDDTVWAKYRWIVFERITNKRVGEFRTHLAFAPFVVRGSILIYETAPFVREEKAEPAKLRGVNLETGQETWNVEVRELIFRGSYPP